MRPKHFAIDHDVDRPGKVKFNAPGRAPRSQRMTDVRAVIKRVQVRDEPEAADRAPADKFDESVAAVGIGGDAHLAAGVLRVVECQEQAASEIPLAFAVHTQWEGAAIEASKADQNSQQIAQLAEGLEAPVGNVRKEPGTDTLRGARDRVRALGLRR